MTYSLFVNYNNVAHSFCFLHVPITNVITMQKYVLIPTLIQEAKTNT
jgi:hypothetical protein